MSNFGWLSLTVPGVPVAYETLSKKFGSFLLQKVLAPAIVYNEKEFPVSSVVETFERMPIRDIRNIR